MLSILMKRLRMINLALNAFITQYLKHLDLFKSMFLIREEPLDLLEFRPLTIWPRLETIMKKSKKLLNSKMETMLSSSLLRSETTITGSQMKISTFSYTTQTHQRNFKDKILEPESPLSMMTSPDRFASRSPSLSRPLPPKKLQKLLLLERMDLTERLQQITKPFNLIHQTILLLQMLTIFIKRDNLYSTRERPKKLFQQRSSRETKK